jgi:hypothetical protein
MIQQLTRDDPRVTAVRQADALAGTRLRVQLCAMDRGPV